MTSAMEAAAMTLSIQQVSEPNGTGYLLNAKCRRREIEDNLLSLSSYEYPVLQIAYNLHGQNDREGSPYDKVALIVKGWWKR